MKPRLQVSPSMPNTRCAVLVPVTDHIEADCERGLQELESRGYAVRRLKGIPAIDLARSQLATDALAEGFDELMWIDADVAFEADSVARLQAHHLPLACGLYPKKGQRALACHVLPGTKEISFGHGGGVVELLYGCAGFLLTQRDVYRAIQQTERLPVCHAWSQKPLVPYFLPMIVPKNGGHWYLSEDFAFFERARRCGYPVYADTTIRLWHIGSYGYSWEDAGIDRERYGSFIMKLE